MWSPTHIQVTVQRARGLLTKGKNDTNNCFVTIALGKEKYQTSIQEKATKDVSWNEECELKIPDQGNRAELTLTCLHRNNLSLDEFLGQVTLPLNEMDVYDRPRSKWFKLESKPGKEKKNKDRGELEVRICFVVKSGSLTDLSKKEKHKSSIGQLATSVGGSLLSIGTIEKRKGIKKFAKSLGSKMHLSSKKKNKDGDDISSYSGSQLSIGTPNSSIGGNRRNGQRAGEADPGVISEDEDEFVFDNLSHKSSGSSLNIRNSLQATQNFVPRKPSPLLNANGKLATTKLGKQLHKHYADEDLVIDPELEEIENDFSVRARNLLPPPSKPPRTPQNEPLHETLNNTKANGADEWESKLYGDIGSSNSLKRRSWEQNRVPLIAPAAEEKKQAAQPQEPVNKVQPNEFQEISLNNANDNNSCSSTDSEIDDVVADTPVKKPLELQLSSSPAKPTQNLKLLSPEREQNKFDEFNATFAKFEQRNSSKIFEDEDKNIFSSTFIKREIDAASLPQPLPRNRERELELKKAAEQAEEAEKQRQAAEARERQLRAEEDARLEEELRLNEQRLREEEAALQKELQQREEEKRREAKRLEEDQRILNFAKRSVSLEEEQQQNIKETLPVATPEQSPKQKDATVELREKRIGKFKYANKRDKNDDDRNSSSPKSSERIIIGHEKSTTQAERRAEISAALAKKYEGKSREEIMLIANGMENEALLQRQRVKELEDYLDNLLLRVMETHPKILQNPYHRTTSAKSG